MKSRLPMKPDPMSTPEAAGRSPALAQAVAAPLTRAAIFLVATLNPGSDNRATLRSFCGDLAALVRAVEFRDLEGRTFLRHGVWVRRVGPPLRAAAAGRAASLPGDSLWSAPCGFHARRLAVPHPRQAHGFVLRAGHADYGAYREMPFRRWTKCRASVTSTTAI